MKTRDDVARIMSETFARLDKLREQGQKEYAHDSSNALRNFEALAGELGIPRDKVLWIFMKKHLDGILAHINGHRSQRESVHGRIDDVHVYLELLRAMIIDDMNDVTPPRSTLDTVLEERERSAMRDLSDGRINTLD